MHIFKDLGARGGLIFGADPNKQINFLNQIYPITSITRILDIGCDRGRHLRKLVTQSNYLFGIDRKECHVEGATTFCCDFITDELPEEICNIDLTYFFSPFLGENWNKFDILVQKLAERIVQGGKFILDLFHYTSLPQTMVYWRLRRDRGARLRTICFRCGNAYFESDYRCIQGREFQIEKQKRWPVFTKSYLETLFSQNSFDYVASYADFDISRPYEWNVKSQPPFPRLAVVFEKR